jgi:hypothetical protein
MKRRSLIILLTLVLVSVGGHQTLSQTRRRQPPAPLPKAQPQSKTRPRQTPAAKPSKSPNDVPGYYWEKCAQWRELAIGEVTREEALKRAYKIAADYPKWHSYLPPCPLTVAEVRKHPLFTGFEMWLGRRWEGALFIPECFHPGADECFRSKLSFPSETFETDPLANYHGQQCCYAKSGNLITTGPAAGTPDFVTSALDDAGEKALAPLKNGDDDKDRNHIYFDVLPWTKLSVNDYHVSWPPNQGPQRAFRTIVSAKGKTSIRGGLVFGDFGPGIITAGTKGVWHHTHLRVAKGDVVRVKAVKGRVKVSEGVESGPEGVKNPSPQQSLAMAAAAMVVPITDPRSPVGSLVAALYAGDYDAEDGKIDPSRLSDPFYIGPEREIEVLGDGYLMLTVNDTMPDDNDGYFIVELQVVR